MGQVKDLPFNRENLMKTRNNVNLSHPVYPCVFRITIRFGSTYLGSCMSVETNVITTRTQLTQSGKRVKRDEAILLYVFFCRKTAKTNLLGKKECLEKFIKSP